MRAFLIAIAVLVLALSASTPTMAWSIDGTQLFSAAVSGENITTTVPQTWVYTLKNTSPSSVYEISLLQIDVDEGTDIISAFKPAGWDEPNLDVENFVSWTCNRNASFRIKAGQSINEFKVVFSKKPEYQNWSVMFVNTESDESPADGGAVVMGSPVPEPTSLAAFVVGLASLVGLRKRSIK